MSEKIFDLSSEQIRKQLNSRDGHAVDPQSEMRPIRPGETLEPCIRGAKKINADPELKELVKGVLRR